MLMPLIRPTAHARTDRCDGKPLKTVGIQR